MKLKEASPSELRLNLGCGRRQMEGWVNCDLVKGPGVDRVFDLEAPPYPFEDNVVGRFILSHTIEHVRNDLKMMQELHRIARPGAEMRVMTPYGGSDQAFEDPTHVKILFPNSFLYYGQPAYYRADYGYRGDWEIAHMAVRIPKAFERLSHDDKMNQLKMMRNVGREIMCTLKAVKPIREPIESLLASPTIEWEYYE